LSIQQDVLAPALFREGVRRVGRRLKERGRRVSSSLLAT